MTAYRNILLEILKAYNFASKKLNKYIVLPLTSWSKLFSLAQFKRFILVLHETKVIFAVKIFDFYMRPSIVTYGFGRKFLIHELLSASLSPPVLGKLAIDLRFLVFNPQ